MKNQIIKILHLLFGYERYVKLFSIFKIETLSFDNRKTEFLYFNRLLPTDANIIVVGACTGITTVPFARNYPNRKVVAYEPLSSNFSILKNVVNHYKLKNVILINLALGNKTEQQEIILPIINGVKKQGIAHIKSPSLVDYNEGISEMVNLDLLDKSPELAEIKIDGIKVVAENYEQQVFEGAKHLIEKNRPLIYCELWPNEKRGPVLELIKQYNYTVFYLQKNKLVSYDGNNYSGKNFFFKPLN